MRLICGLMRLDGGAASLSLLRLMVAQMDVPRLRPSRSEYCDGSVALAMLDFSATSLGPLPVQGSIMMAADARLDEPAELAQSLNIGVDSPDALLLTVVKRFGTRGLERVLGDFAFAAWDGEANALTCGRDVFGIRPLYYAYKPGELFAFGSLPSALHGGGIIPKTIDRASLVRRVMRAQRFDHTLIKGIARLPPGHALEVSSNGISVRRYWQLNRALVGSARISSADAAKELRRRVDQAVRSRLPANCRVGSHLSGGLDSSAIAVLAARALREEERVLHAYSFLERPRNDVQLEDETAFVAACLAGEGNIDWQPIRPSMREFEEGFALDPHLMHPVDRDDPEIQVATIAERQGVNLILSGWGGDEAVTFNGRGALAELARRGQWRDLKHEIEALAKERRWTRRAVFFREVVIPLVGERLPTSLLQLARRAASGKSGHSDLMHNTLSVKARWALKDVPDVPFIADGRETRWQLINGPHIAHRAEVWALIGARHGLAYSFPLLDRRVVDFALSLPSTFFLSGGFRRRVFRDAMRDVLPDLVRLRHQKYRPFPGRYLDMAQVCGALLARIEALETDPALICFLDVAKLKKLAAGFPAPQQVRQDLAASLDPQGREAMIAVSRMLELATYLQRHESQSENP